MAKKTEITKPGFHYSVRAVAPPVLNAQQWQMAGLFALILATLAAAQLTSFTAFATDLQNIGIKSAGFFAGAIIFVELWGMACCFKLRLSPLFRLFSAGSIVISFGFWLVVALQAFDPPITKHLYMWGDYIWMEVNWLTLSMILVLLLASVYLARHLMGKISPSQKYINNNVKRRKK